MRAAQIRREFLEFFRSKSHEIVPSSPVVPHDDPTLLFANAGMNQFKALFTGAERRDYTRAASTQKCIRAGGKHNDLENVGYTARHLTFFEMLGNFSFGDYFKEEACVWAWEFVTGRLGLDSTHLWITVFHEDDEARAIWRDRVGVSNDRIVGLGEKDNYWSMGDVGPCGPCSEIHIDRGVEFSCGPSCALGVCDCDRWLEFWNLVFMQFEQHADGSKTPLPRPSIDTGMGLERIAQILQGKNSVFETDLLAGLAEEVAQITGRPTSPGPEGTPHRVIADHLRSLSFAIADGAFPSNENRGFVLRRILRRAARYGYKLGMERPFIHELVDPLIREMGDAFPELRSNREVIRKLIHSEEESFGRTLRSGMTRFDEEVEALRASGARTFPGDAAFFLHDTCGFPIDLTEQMARELELGVDRERFDQLMEEQRRKAQEDRAAKVGHGGAGEDPYAGLPPTTFTGYDVLTGEGSVLAVDGDASDLRLVLTSTPFYAEGGGQVGDCGEIRGAGFTIRVTDTQKSAEGVFIHRGKLEDGDFTRIVEGGSVSARVDDERRAAIQRNHTATHLLHAALRSVLGAHVQQKGSLVAPDRLRFDLSHFERIGGEEIERIEEIVQSEILRDVEVDIREQDREEAIAAGAMAFFGEKYGDRVRVVQVPGFSTELCGGAHVHRTGEIGGFQIVLEGSVSAGVRRVEAVTGLGALERSREDRETLRRVSTLLKASRDEVVERLESLLAENKELRSGKKKGGGDRDLLQDLGRVGESAEVGGAELVTAIFESAEMDEMLRVADSLKRRSGPRVFILASGTRFVVGHSDDLPKGRVHAGEIARDGAKVLGGGGGGRPDLAQAGGKDASKLNEAVELMRTRASDALAG
ncbi:MAG: alanine--tRNA ligase [Planctomycetes bacterium]|nr:alanine--tRNA ligase [Planctomycetota bacterium]